MTYLMCVLGTERGSSAKAADALNKGNCLSHPTPPCLASLRILRVTVTKMYLLTLCPLLPSVTLSVSSIKVRTGEGLRSLTQTLFQAGVDVRQDPYRKGRERLNIRSKDPEQSLPEGDRKEANDYAIQTGWEREPGKEL